MESPWLMMKQRDYFLGIQFPHSSELWSTGSSEQVLEMLSSICSVVQAAECGNRPSAGLHLRSLSFFVSNPSYLTWASSITSWCLTIHPTPGWLCLQGVGAQFLVCCEHSGPLVLPKLPEWPTAISPFPVPSCPTSASGGSG